MNRCPYSRSEFDMGRPFWIRSRVCWLTGTLILTAYPSWRLHLTRVSFTQSINNEIEVRHNPRREPREELVCWNLICRQLSLFFDPGETATALPAGKRVGRQFHRGTVSHPERIQYDLFLNMGSCKSALFVAE